ncbi:MULTISPECIES: hypothetical protein [unclassified Streptomyces]|uniref:hypothetical protein n=1 Tax=unclassified Streptomyces TaxID=2593676 RepID=UPI000DAC9248|nr:MULTISPECIES: hypothetical protein [unclassified Streptomyces]PZT72372.1 hypothetical protein DNK55_27925 [Streptomyces sp. AC1-42T]PZT81309.1 hypothetical protein DNK56_03645 [Streptomyces sp. AC1-42W]
MSDVLSLSAVAAAALQPTFTFLYGRLEALLNRHEGRDVTDELTTSELPSTLVGTVALPLVANGQRLDEHASQLRMARTVLTRYQHDPALVVPDDSMLTDVLGQLRVVLEEIYSHRFTFIGESRERSGPLVVQRIDNVSGNVTGMQAGAAIFTGKVDQEFKTVSSGSTVIGMSAPVIGGEA